MVGGTVAAAPIGSGPLVLSPLGFAAVVWVTIVLVLAVLGYELYAVARDAGWL